MLSDLYEKQDKRPTKASTPPPPNKHTWTEKLPEELFATVLNTMLTENFANPIDVRFPIDANGKCGQGTHFRHQWYTWRKRILQTPENYPDHFFVHIDRIRVSRPAISGDCGIVTFSDKSATERALFLQLADRFASALGKGE